MQCRRAVDRERDGENGGLGGTDHLLVLFGVVLVGGALRKMLAVVSAFTLAHSITLGLAVLGVWVPRPGLVEPAIALSIVYVGLENCRRPDLDRRWRLAFVFGLVHGFGFAGELREVALSAAELPVALAFFNAGVELGQLAVLACVGPWVWWLGRRAWFVHGGLQTASLAIAAMGAWWFVTRVAGGCARAKRIPPRVIAGCGSACHNRAPRCRS